LPVIRLEQRRDHGTASRLRCIAHDAGCDPRRGSPCWIAPVAVYTGEDELLDLAEGSFCSRIEHARTIDAAPAEQAVLMHLRPPLRIGLDIA